MLNVKFVSVIFLENRHQGFSIHDVPEETIKKMKKRFDKIIIKQAFKNLLLL